jgi:hypothetical protein
MSDPGSVRLELGPAPVVPYIPATPIEAADIAAAIAAAPTDVNLEDGGVLPGPGIAAVAAAVPVAPPAIDVQDSSAPPEPGIPIDAIATARPVEPSPLSVSGLPPLTRVGYELARFVLWIICGAIAATFLCLIAIEIENLRATNSASTELLGYTGAMSDPDRLRKEMAGAIAVFRNAVNQPAAATGRDDRALVADMARDLRESRRLTEQQSKQLDGCVAQLALPPGGAVANATDRQTALEDCIKMLAAIDLGTISQGLDIEYLRTRREIAKDMLDARQAVRSFWLSIAQLVLLNLLLPILTALLGYIFGTQQGTRQ